MTEPRTEDLKKALENGGYTDKEIAVIAVDGWDLSMVASLLRTGHKKAEIEKVGAFILLEKDLKEEGYYFDENGILSDVEED